MRDDIQNLVHTDEFSITEDEFHNLILHFEKNCDFEKGQKIIVQSSHIADKGRRQAIEEALALVSKYQHMLTNPVSEIIEKLEEMKK